jgi:hypothetical protein
MVNEDTGFAIGKPQVVTYSETGLGLHFPNAEIEKAYRDVASSGLYNKVKHFKRLALPLSMCLVAVHAFASRKIQLFSGSLWDLTLRFELSFAIDVAFVLIVSLLLLGNVAVHVTTKTNVEHQACFVINVLPCAMLCLNPIRTHRVLPGWFESIESLNALGESCDFNAVEMQKDTRIICSTLLFWGFFFRSLSGTIEHPIHLDTGLLDPVLLYLRPSHPLEAERFSIS